MFGHDDQDNNNYQEENHNEITPTEHHDPVTQDDHQITPVQPADNTAHDNGLGGFVPTPTEPPPSTPPAAATDDLLDIKQEALEALTPLVGQLDQTPEEQFRTTMMMIQASDNHALVKVAYDAAKRISNEKERAQALLDIVNEINYFTQHAQA